VNGEGENSTLLTEKGEKKRALSAAVERWGRERREWEENVTGCGKGGVFEVDGGGRGKHWTQVSFFLHYLEGRVLRSHIAARLEGSRRYQKRTVTGHIRSQRTFLVHRSKRAVLSKTRRIPGRTCAGFWGFGAMFPIRTGFDSVVAA
jgi:hypothetical protein